MPKHTEPLGKCRGMIGLKHIRKSLSNHYLPTTRHRLQWSHMTVQNYFTKVTNKIIATNSESVGEEGSRVRKETYFFSIQSLLCL